MGDQGGDIIIKGGSCEIHFDATLYDKDPADPKRRSHKYDSYKIRRIVITGDASFRENFPDGFKGEIKIFCAP